MANLLLEIAAFTLQGAITAQDAGADRVEFCENPADGGTTPSYGALKAVRKFLSIPVFPIIRPRAGDFFYSEAEYSAMREDVLICKSLDFKGVVLGTLHKNGSVDLERTRELCELAYPMQVTFHRAFDRCKAPLESLEAVIEAGCHRILTSGQYPVAQQGAALIRKLVNQAGDRIIIMPGSGVRSNNVADLVKTTGAKEFHSSARVEVSSPMDFLVPTMQENLTYMDVDASEVSAMRAVLHNCH